MANADAYGDEGHEGEQLDWEIIYLFILYFMLTVNIIQIKYMIIQN